MPDCKSVYAPMEPNVKLLPNKGKSCLDAYRYKRLVGKINYLTMAKPDVAFVASQFLNGACNSHWNAVVRILRYIKRPPRKWFVYTE